MRKLRGGQTEDLIYPSVPDSALSYRNWVPPRINRESGKLEMHVPLGSYIGPGSDVVRRLAENVKPTTRTDRAAQRHDIDYYNIRSGMRKSRISSQQAREKVRQADNLLMAESRRGITNIANPLNMAHSAAALSGIKAKTIGEDINVIDPLLFVGRGSLTGPQGDIKGINGKRINDPLAKMRQSMIN